MPACHCWMFEECTCPSFSRRILSHRLCVGVIPRAFSVVAEKIWVGAQRSWGYIAGTGGAQNFQSQCYFVSKSRLRAVCTVSHSRERMHTKTLYDLFSLLSLSRIHTHIHTHTHTYTHTHTRTHSLPLPLTLCFFSFYPSLCFSILVCTIHRVRI
jgi:hypothetical protein